MKAVLRTVSCLLVGLSMTGCTFGKNGNDGATTQTPATASAPQADPAIDAPPPPSSAGTPDADGVPPMDPEIAGYSYEQLQDAGTYLLAVAERGSDKTKKPTKILACDPTSETALIWMSGPLRAAIEEKRAEAQTAYQKSPASLREQATSCVGKCHCDALLSIVSGADEHFAGPGSSQASVHREITTLLKARLPKQNAEATRTCASRVKWFCESPLHKYLIRSEAP